VGAAQNTILHLRSKQPAGNRDGSKAKAETAQETLAQMPGFGVNILYKVEMEDGSLLLGQ
jgi:hypothetical protein